MTKDELIQELIKIQNEKYILRGVEVVDKEGNHIKADELLLRYINDDRVTQEFNKIEKWYS